jgi:glucose/arabinose dehydrogenase
MTERGGKISRVNPATGVATALLTIGDVSTQGEGGLLGMTLHPQFTNTPQVFVAYNYNSSSTYNEKVVRYTYDGTTLTNPVLIFDNIKASSIHNGCRLLVMHDKIFISTGDAADQSLPQNTNTLNGKILRLNLDGTIPVDNPIASNPIWSWGHRNPQGLVLINNKLFSSEHGPDTDDEINIIEKGSNYGWPNVKGYCNESSERSFCNANSVKEPIEAWSPTLAVSGIDYYESDEIPQWKNSLLVATLKNSRLYQLKLNSDKTDVIKSAEFFNSTYGRIRDVCVAPNGKVYICTSNGSNDKLIEISKKQ